MVGTVAAGWTGGQPAVSAERVTVRVPGTTVTFDLVYCVGGEVEGDDGQAVNIPDMWVLPTEVTWDLYDVFLYALDEPEGEGDGAITRPSKPYVPPDRGFGHSGYPAIGMTRNAAERFCEWLEAKTGIPARLPLPEEWTYLAGPAPTDLDLVAWHSGTADRTTMPVGQKDANVFGLYDTLGNTAEWVITDGKRPIAMGGSFRDEAARCTNLSSQRQQGSWNVSDPQIPKSQWWLADCSWVGFRFVVDADKMPMDVLNAGREDEDD